MYRYTVGKHLEGAAEAQSWARLTDASPQSISARLKQLVDAAPSPKTVNAHRADLNAFFAWCTHTGRLEANPCATVPKSKVKADKKRRVLSPSEIRDLQEAAPPERAICYRFLLLTGLRRSEAAQITWAHLHLDGVNAQIELPPSITKSGQPEAVPLIPDLAAALRDHRGEAKPGDPVFDEIPSMPDFRDDLADAGIEEVDARGRRVPMSGPCPGSWATDAPPLSTSTWTVDDRSAEKSSVTSKQPSSRLRSRFLAAKVVVGSSSPAKEPVVVTDDPAGSTGSSGCQPAS
ncbi:MAG: tyrosine-type recombinase/integrase [Phycisphaerales bacterium]|nr:tyrosine-type recombinase/integrase [Phycisphaerales bacterium]